MNELEIREAILRVFNNERQNNNASFVESHCLDFLTFPASKPNGIKNSFKGARKYYRFMDAIELEFGVCFPLKDLDRSYSVESLVEKVSERMEKASGNKKILRYRNEQKEKFIPEMVLSVILVLTFFWIGIHWITITLTVIFGLAIYWLVTSRIYNRKQLKKLNLRMLGRER